MPDLEGDRLVNQDEVASLPRVGISDRWSVVPAARDEAERFATEFGIALRGTLEAAASACDRTLPTRASSSVTVGIRHRETIGRAVDTVHGIEVDISAELLHWELTLPSGARYEGPVTLAARFLAEHARLRAGPT